MKMIRQVLWVGVLVVLGASSMLSAHETPQQDPIKKWGQQEQAFLTNIRQLVTEGLRAGEGYFSTDGKKMIFQSERDVENPFYQIYEMDLQTGATQKVSPGIGKTTCAWIHPEGQRVLFSSTHEDPLALQKQRAELDRRASGKPAPYAWDYDETYDLYEYSHSTQQYHALTRQLGYDAEASWSPDGKLIAFASNRDAYQRELTDEEKIIFEKDKSYFIDLYIMDSDGKNVRQLTHSPGYDGGPFFSPDGARVVWRRFTADGRQAEVHSMRIDGTEERQLTRLGVMSWAPFFHPSGDYVIFATSLQGHRNFELYIVDVEGKHEPVRVTDTEGFDGLPVFTPDGKKLAWTSSRTSTGVSQIFIADWNDAEARAKLGLPAGRSLATRTQDHVEFFAHPRFGGRLTGTVGEADTAQYVADFFKSLGLKPMGESGRYFQSFDFTAGAELGANNQLKWANQSLKLDQDWRPLSFSKNGASFPSGGIVFAGYGIVAPEAPGFPAYDAYSKLNPSDVVGRWVMVLRYHPEDVAPAYQQYLARYSSLRAKAVAAREMGALGIIVVSGPRSGVQRELVDFSFDVSQGQDGIFSISITDAVAQGLLQSSGKKLDQLQAEWNSGSVDSSFAWVLSDPLEVGVEVHPLERISRNVVGRLQIGNEPSDQYVIVGAHLDHLGHGEGSTSRARGDERGMIHPGADDNASGVAVLLETARLVAAQEHNGKKRDVIFVAWSGEELGTLGSLHALRAWANFWGKGPNDPLHEKVAAYLNLDMVGRMRGGELMVQGLGSSADWATRVAASPTSRDVFLRLSDDPYLPTDSTSFYLKGIPTLSLFTGSHDEYHTPRDTPEKLNRAGMAQTVRLMTDWVSALSSAEAAPAFRLVERRPGAGEGRQFRVILGVIPDYTYSGSPPGLKLSGVQRGGPAEAAGMTNGDLVIALAGRPVTSIYDYVYMLGVLKPGVAVDAQILRDGQAMTLSVTPISRE